ncbi:MAG: hypothetical protein J0J10_20125 [Bosea sp.]|uniref:hypothetical protein n=1 Tax=Bosea sp. (in: a-proteobacteria) TaxID=1871050 RepID=UPI001AD177EA|nr:hypothetical protein [Bosea sp. (in: a-proteobacteria)]MBN9471080.1 hypothetical protein [Bosea sp. (in: a-proteobacteria)]
MDIIVYEGAPGSRKTLTLLDQFVSVPGRYLVAFPRTPLIDEQADYCRQKAKEVGTRPFIVSYHSKQPSHRRQVGRQIEKALKANAGLSHVVIMITHSALLDLDPRLLAGWHTGIDENLDGSVVSGTFRASASWSVLERHYRLDPLPGGRVWQALPRDGAPRLTRHQIAAEGSNDLTRFHTYASNPHRAVFVDVGDWQDAQIARREVRWWSIWTPLVLDQCASVTFTAAGYFESLPCRAAKWLSGGAINYAPIDLGVGKPRASPRVRIHFYTARHVGSTAWWETDDGNRCLVQVSRHQETIGGPGYWSCNEDIRSVFRNRFPGTLCQPKQAGTNSLIHHTSCMFIYSSKPQADDASIIDLLGLNRDDIRRAREFEDIRQFVMRGAIRRPDYAGSYDIYLYDFAQAEDLEIYLRGIGITDVETMPVYEANIMEIVRPSAAASAKKTPLSREEKRKRNTASQRERRAEIKAKEEANGIVRRRGRPKNGA